MLDVVFSNPARYERSGMSKNKISQLVTRTLADVGLKVCMYYGTDDSKLLK